MYEMLFVSLASTSRAVLACLSLCLLALPAAFAADLTDIAAFREARFGLFIHWGLYSQLGGRWKGQTMDYIGEWIQSRYRIPNAEYAKVADVFNPVFFDADDWARQAKAAGMEYVVFTTKHHDGFSMFETHVSDYNIVDATPFKRDAFGEFAAACRRQGLKVGLYYSQNLDWHEFDAADPEGNAGRNRDDLFNKGMSWGNTWDFPDATNKNLDRYLKAKVYPQLKELLTNYGEIFVIWFDCPNGMSAKQSQDLKDYVRSLQPHVLVSGRIGNGLGDFDTPGDNQLLAGKSDFPLECPITLNDTWGFKYDDHNWKTGYSVAFDLMETLSGNANLILNIAPRPDGRLTDASSDVIRELAD
ncbi:MAG: alpha-L-fucosidase, partial [bacterium]|nr:alpha-L-fucosidase [Candidatus Colisoma equi]